MKISGGKKERQEIEDMIDHRSYTQLKQLTAYVVYNCDDQSCLHIFSAVQICDLSYHHLQTANCYPFLCFILLPQ